MSVHYRHLIRFFSALAGLLLLMILRCGAAHASTDPWAPFETPWFDKLGVSEGLPHSITTAIAQDSRGLIWIGTKGGLVRYDGYRMVVFEMARGDVVGLPDTYVRSLLPLPNGGMLVGTSDGGLARFDPATGTFHVYPVDANGTSDSKIYGLAGDHANGVWIANDRGLDHLDLATNTISHLKTGSEMAQRNFSVLQDRAGNLWIGNNNGLFVRSAGSSNFVRPNGAVGAAAAVLANQIWAIQEDREGRLWVGSGQAGAAYRDTDGQWRSVPSSSGGQAGVAQPTVRDFLEVASGAMWIATDGTGVIEYVPGSDHVRAIFITTWRFSSCVAARSRRKYLGSDGLGRCPHQSECACRFLAAAIAVA
jgi:ligand-binding sensor domain-containing protein